MSIVKQGTTTIMTPTDTVPPSNTGKRVARLGRTTRPSSSSVGTANPYSDLDYCFRRVRTNSLSSSPSGVDNQYVHIGRYNLPPFTLVAASQSPESRPFLCRMGDVCELTLKGHFYGGTQKNVGIFAVNVMKDVSLEACGLSLADQEGPVKSTGVPSLETNVKQPVNTGFRSHISPSQVEATVEPSDLLLLDDEYPLHSLGNPGVCLEPGDGAAQCPLSPVGSEAIAKEGAPDRTYYSTRSSYLFNEQTRATEDPFLFALSESAENIKSEMSATFRPGKVVHCSYDTTGFRPQAYCRASLGLVAENLGPGTFTLCGCSSTDLTNSGVSCSSASDFAVPIGRLVIAGFDSLSRSQETTRHPEIRDTRETRHADDGAADVPVDVLLNTNTHTITLQHAERNESLDRENKAIELTGNSEIGPHEDSPDEAAAQITPATLSESSTVLSPRVFTCRIGSVCELSKMRGAGLDSGPFYVHALKGKYPGGCAVFRDEYRLAHMDAPIRLPCKPYGGGSYCIASARPAALAALATQLKPNAKATVVMVERETTQSAYARSSGNSSKAPSVVPLLAKFERKTADSGGPKAKVDETVLFSEDSSTDPDRMKDESLGHAIHVDLGEPAVRRLDSTGSPWVADRYQHSQQSGVRAEEALTDTGVRHSVSAGPLDDLVSDSPMPVGIEEDVEGETWDVENKASTQSSVIATATLCGCSSQETDERHCTVPVFLGYLRIKPPQGDPGSKLGEKYADADGKPSGYLRENARRDVNTDAPTNGNHESGRRSSHLGEELIPLSGESAATKTSSLLVQEGDLKSETPDANASAVPSSGGTSASSKEPQQPQDELVLTKTQREALGSERESAEGSLTSPPGSSQWRLLQYITGPAANSQAAQEGKKNDGRLANECKVNTDCFSGMGVCDKGRCVGFIPDKQDSRLFRCVEGYWCDLKPGDIPGKGITEKFEVIATTPSEPCGTARNLKPTESLFANANKWICDSSSPTSCIFRAGVGHRRNKAHTVEGVRLCGCPNLDTNGDDIPCNHVRDFFVPLGRLGVQECLTNAHCADNAFAYCVEDHCGGFLVSAAAAGVNAFTCIRNQQCTLQSIAAKSVDQALKVIPVAANFSCGAEAALDPDYVKASALPCIADVNNDGVCEISLGVNRALGTTRLCGCSGQDVGGNGKTCDEASDFDRDLGLVANVQCIVNQDCPNNAFCAKGECVEDDMEPYIVSMSPMNDTFAVPPLTHIDLVFNENINFGRPGAALLVAVAPQKNTRLSASAEGSAAPLQYLITLPNNAGSLKKISAPFLPSPPAGLSANARLIGPAGGTGTEERRRSEAGRLPLSSLSSLDKKTRPNGEEDEAAESTGSLLAGFGAHTSGAGSGAAGSVNNKWTVEIIGQKLRITPDKQTTSLPIGEYRIGIEFGFVTDLIGNMNKGENNLRFTLATDANCPFLYVTGFTTENGNCNGLYMPADPMNDQASWQGGEKNAFFIYWKKEVREGGKVQQGGNWIVDTNYDESSFLAFADLTEHADKKRGRSRALPPSGLWHKWTGSTRRPQPHVSIFCAASPDRSPASLISVDPPVGSALPLSASTLLPQRPITLTFNKPMNYGHWAAIKLLPRSADSRRRRGGEADASQEETEAGDTPRRRGSEGAVVWVPDQEGNMRGDSIQIHTRPAHEVVPRSMAAITSGGRPLSNAELAEVSPTLHTPPLGASSSPPSSSWLRVSSSSRGLQARDALTPAPLAAAPSASFTAPEKLVGVVELFVREPLVPGETYDLVAELGSLTDLAYNPWGPIEKGTLVFHTTGGRCPLTVSASNLVFLSSSASPVRSPAVSTSFVTARGGAGGDPAEADEPFLLEKGREIVGMRSGDGDADDGTQVRVVCRAGFSVQASQKGSREAEETSLVCEDGRWKSYRPLPKCFPTCGAFPLLPGGAYSINGDVGGEGLEGEKLDIRCTEQAELLTPISRQTVKCRNGKWDALQVKCGATCAPLGPALGPRYRVYLTQASRASAATGAARGGESSARVLENREAKEGETRTVVCAPGTSQYEPTAAARGGARRVGDAQEEDVLCGKAGWSKVRLQCFADCPVEQLKAMLTQRGPGLEWKERAESSGRGGEPDERDGKHGERRTITCAPDFLPASAARSSFSTTCQDGRWQPLAVPEGQSASSSASYASAAAPLCVPRCPPLGLSRAAYVVAPLPEVIAPDGALQQKLEVSCAPQAVSVSSEKRQELVCGRGGVWSLLTVQCKAPCGAPLLQLGDRYELRDSDGVTASTARSGTSPSASAALGSAEEERHTHGTEVLIGCATGAAADGGAAPGAPHKIVCSDGVWKSAYRVNSLLTRDGGDSSGASATAGPAAELQAPGAASGAAAGGAAAAGGVDAPSGPATRQAEIDLKCRRGCGVPALPPELRPLFRAPRVALLQRWHHEQQLQVTCAKGFSAEETRPKAGEAPDSETLVCRDGEWESIHATRPKHRGGETGSQAASASSSAIPGLVLACRRECEAAEISRVAQLNHFDLPSSFALAASLTASSLPHNASLSVACQKGFSVLTGPTHGASLRCTYGSLALPHTVCGAPTCSDGLQNGDEAGVDCGGSECAPCASCSDGIQNNGETGVDCGGPCSPCKGCAHPLTSQLLVPGVDPDLAALSGLLVLPPSLSSSWDGEGSGRGTEFAASTHFRQFLPFSELLSGLRGAFSPEGGHAGGLLPLGRRSIFKRSGAGSSASASSPFFSCPQPTCFDGERNGDETGVDCGGSCAQRCPSCFNGLRDGDEEDVDCGGSTCERCEHCSPRALKVFLTNREAFLVSRPGAQNRSASSAFEKKLDRLLADEGVLSAPLTKSGQHLQLKCKALGGDDSLLQVVCRNGIWTLASARSLASEAPAAFSSFFASSRGSGMWWPKQAAEAHQALEAFRRSCLAASAAQTPALEGTAITALDTGASSSSSSASSASTASFLGKSASPLTWRVGAALASFAVPDFGVSRDGQTHPPCISRLIEVFRASLRGECGALAFGNSPQKLSSFCANSCFRSLRTALESVLGEAVWDASPRAGSRSPVRESVFDEAPGDGGERGASGPPFYGCASPEEGAEAKEIAQLLLELLRTWCAQRSGLYCFAEASSSFHFLRSLYAQAEASPAFFRSEVKSYCPANSCFRNNIKHVLILGELSRHVDIRLPAFDAAAPLTKEALPTAGLSRTLRARAAWGRDRRLAEGRVAAAAGGGQAGGKAARDGEEARAEPKASTLEDERADDAGGGCPEEAAHGGHVRAPGARSDTPVAGAAPNESAREAKRDLAEDSAFVPWLPPSATFAEESETPAEPRRLFPASPASGGSPTSPLVRVDVGGRAADPSLARGTQGFLEDIRNASEILDLFCLEVDGRLCVEEVLRVGMQNPVLASPSGGDDDAQKICRGDTCLLEVTRVFGQVLIDTADRQSEDFLDKHFFQPPQNAARKRRDGKHYSRRARAGVPTQGDAHDKSGAADFHPYNVVLGILMKHWGRTFCHRNIRGSLCGGYVFPSPLDAALAEQSRDAYLPTENEKRYRSCSCHYSLIGDGDCDPECFNEACGWDGSDCLATEVLFPVYRHLVNQLGTELSDPCNPFNSNFSCEASSDAASPARRASPSSHRNCGIQFNRLAETRGCCLATQLEVLRDLLEADVRILEATGASASRLIVSPASAASRSSLSLPESSTHKRGDDRFSSRLQRQQVEDAPPAVPTQLWKGRSWIHTDRSTAFFEFACKRQLDRTCSRGLNRFAYAVEMKIENVDFDFLLEASPSSSASVFPGSAQLPGAWASSSASSLPPSQSPLTLSPSPAREARESEGNIAVGASPGETPRIDVLSTRMTPRQTELRRVLREEIASLLAVPAGDVVEMRLWRGSVDVSAVVDAGWLANKLRFKERLDTLAEDQESPLSLTAALSSSLTRHLLPSSSSPLLAVVPARPSPRLLSLLPQDRALPITLVPAHSRISQVAFQSVLPAAPAPASAPPRPLFGTFGVAELPVASRPCEGTQGLNPPEGTSVYDAYKIWANTGTRGGSGNEHGSTMAVECNTGHEAVEGEAPQNLVCNQGRWEPSASAASASLPLLPGLEKPRKHILVCRQPCQPYEKIDPSILRPEFIVSGFGTSDGDARTVMCAPGYSPRDVEATGATETIECVNGAWKPPRRLMCGKDFAALSGSSSSPCSGALSGLEESYKLTEVPLAPSANPDVSSDLATALKVRLQPTATTVQIFKVTCARGYIHAPQSAGSADSAGLQAQTSLGGKSSPAEVFLACLEGGLVGLGSEELFPLGGSAEGRRAEMLAENFTQRLKKATPVKLPLHAHTDGGMPDASRGEASPAQTGERERYAPTGALESDRHDADDGIRKSLVCIRDVRLDPPATAKPISDTVMVFLCLLILFVLVVALIAGWWLRNARKKRKLGKLVGGSDGKCPGDGGSEDEEMSVDSKGNFEFKRRTTGEAVLDGTVMVSGAGAEQFLTNYLLGVGGAKLLAGAGDASGRNGENGPPGALMLGPLKDQDLIAAQMYIDQAHAETSPSFAKPCELMTPATAAMVLGSTHTAHQALLLLQQQRWKAAGDAQATGWTRGAPPTADSQLGQTAASSCRQVMAARDGNMPADGESGGTSAYCVSPVYLHGLPGDRGSVQDVRDQSVLEDGAHSTSASRVPPSSHMSVGPNSPISMRVRQRGGMPLGMPLSSGDGAELLQGPGGRRGSSGGRTSSNRKRGSISATVDQNGAGDMSLALPQQDLQHRPPPYSEQYEQALLRENHLRSVPLSVDDGLANVNDYDEEEENNGFEAHQVDTSVFGTASPSLRSHQLPSKPGAPFAALGHPTHPKTNHNPAVYCGVEREAHDAAREEAAREEAAREEEAAVGVSGFTKAITSQWPYGRRGSKACRQTEPEESENSTQSSHKGRAGSAVQAPHGSGKWHRLHLQHPELSIASSEETARQTPGTPGSADAVREQIIGPVSQAFYSTPSDDELYPDDSASCVGLHGYRMGRDPEPVTRIDLKRTTGTMRESSTSATFLHANDWHHRQTPDTLIRTETHFPLTGLNQIPEPAKKPA
ncbi:sushi domain (scr repeat) domain-containing protein [Besnoitia besnoiti]|uniref:Sushi domain (Scr repeat) domain-containing protein n=1 Tax=Besnoitia besnoiti TaxID=94643 RepID=A0A2A9M9G9_BESBE|nr:sushi domain (scr repeat) domain-containing protein [Besnoitia besnoiti]PFH32323.1 sushi domain (scr repeat) domain-containing protein [Besnoitia besnoiti]